MKKQSRQDLGFCSYSRARYSKKCFTQIYKALCGDAKDKELSFSYQNLEQ